jgi:hypothetical protein
MRPSARSRRRHQRIVSSATYRAWSTLRRPEDQLRRDLDCLVQRSVDWAELREHAVHSLGGRPVALRRLEM